MNYDNIIKLKAETNNKQLLDEVFVMCGIIKVGVSVISQAEGEADNTDTKTLRKSQKPNSIIVLLYISRKN